MDNRDIFYPDERLVMKYILADTYHRLNYNEEKNRYIDVKSEIELTIDEYVNMQSVLEKLGVTIY